MNDFAENLKNLRKEHGLTQSQLAKAIGVTASTIGRWEKGISSPAVSSIYNLAIFFKTTSKYFLGH
ncbi:MAG: helix-turn-helix domain-containing protein [Firmicutes bacterium]|nr:helix-turn-helix domain-containing protein [Bacillota bacterium]